MHVGTSQGWRSGVAFDAGARGEALWKLLEEPSRADTKRLFVAALNRSHNLPVDNGYPSAR